MAEGDTILRAARRIEAALAGEELAVRAVNPRGRAAGVERLDGRRLEGVGSHGKHLLLGFGELVLHSHLGMNGSWRVRRRGGGWGRAGGGAWVVLSGSEHEAAQFGGTTLRVLRREQVTRDRVLARLGPDILSPDLDRGAARASLARAGGRELGDALLDQRLIAGIGNIFKSEACFAARVSPWRPVEGCDAETLDEVIDAARRLMSEAVESGRSDRAVYRRAGRPCRRCGTPIASAGQGDANRRTYWCPRCQPGYGPAGARPAK